MTFVTPQILAKLGKLNRGDADQAPFGIVQVDAAGRVLLCNTQASRHLGKTAPDVEGKNFFLHVAPCARNRVFQGRFENGVSAGELNCGFSYAWIKDGQAVLTAVHLLYDRVSKTYWIFFQPAHEAPDAAAELFASMEEQLAALYQDRAGREVMEIGTVPKQQNQVAIATPVPVPAPAPQADPEQAKELAALRREKDALAAELKILKTRARDIGAAMFEAALFGKEVRKRAAGE